MIHRRRSPSSWLPGFVLAVASLVPAWVAPPMARANPDATVYPASPCTRDTVVVLVRGFLPTPCDSFVGAFKVDDGTVRRITTSYFHRMCFAAPSQFFTVPVPMARFSAGHHEIQLEQWTILRDETGAPIDTSVALTTASFDVVESCSPPEMPVEKLPFVLSAKVVPGVPCPWKPAWLHLEGVFMKSCAYVAAGDTSGYSDYNLTIAPDPPVRGLCPPALVPWSVDLPLGAIAGGYHYRLMVRMVVIGSAFTPTLTYRGIVHFEVPEDCNAGYLPYVNHVVVGPKPGHAPPNILCEGDSLQVTLAGTFPSPCFSVDSLYAYESPIAAPFLVPPIVRLVVSDNGCSDIACPAVLQPWSRTLTIHGMPRGSWVLPVEEERTLGCPPVRDFHTTEAPFTVISPESCDVVSPRCLHPSWGNYVNEQCASFISPGDTEDLAIHMVSPVALAGLEGSLHVRGEGARITGLETIGPAVGMHLSWTPTADGARFVLFALEGAPIPGHSPIDLSIDPLLKVSVALAAQSPADRIELSMGADMLGSDAEGHGVPMCSWERDHPPTAVICVGKGECDYNADGGLDVRDLVLMARCLRLESGCISPGTLFDCDGDGAFGVGDVLCCATELLGGPGCPSCPADSVRAAPDVAVQFGALRSLAGGVDVPLKIFGSLGLGAARLKLRFPSDRFDITAVGVRAGWIRLHKARGNELDLGLINSFGPVPGNVYTGDPLEVTLRLTLRAGSKVGGSVALLGGEFSGDDGVKLRVNLGAPELDLGDVGGVSLSAARPNPFEGSTRFSVQMERRGPLEVGVYDLAGRRISTLFQGIAEAGARSFSWDGRTDDGTKVPGGVYFYRALAGGQSVTKRMVMLRGR